MSPSLVCKELLGHFVTVQHIQGGNNVPAFLQEFKHRRKTATGMPSQAEMEAHTLGRIVHMEMLMHNSPREALENRPSLEIALRRFFALLYVEEAMNTGKFKDRTSAWQFVHLLHESVPMEHRHVRPHRRCHDPAYVSGEEAGGCDQGPRGSPNNKALQSSELSKPCLSREPAPRSQRSPRSSGASRPPRASRPPLVHPRSTSNTFPITSDSTPDTPARAAAAAIKSLNMLYTGPRKRLPQETPSPLQFRAPAQRARSNIFRIMHDTCDTSPARTPQPGKATVNIANLPPYQFFPEFLAIFSHPDLSAQRGIFQRIQADKLDLPPSRPPPDPRHPHLWINRLPSYIKNLFKEPEIHFGKAVLNHLRASNRESALPPPRLYASKKDYAALLGKAEEAGMLHGRS